VARLESGFPSLQKKAWNQSPHEANKKKEERHYPFPKEKSSKMFSIILKIFISSIAYCFFFYSSHKLY
jgi:hypothetical protein